uniref:Uncharacterized protein n=1 Tax=Chenopodium quinoa TaxID=63459 RepID=A0A803MIX2_CHEQI
MDSWKSNLTSFALIVLINLPLACCSSLKEALPVSSHLEDNSDNILSLSIATAGAIKSIKTFENSFNNNHQRIGLALYVAIWVQAAIGFCRPHR